MKLLQLRQRKKLQLKKLQRKKLQQKKLQPRKLQPKKLQPKKLQRKLQQKLQPKKLQLRKLQLRKLQPKKLQQKKLQRNPATYTVVNISASEDTTVTATSDAEEFRYEVSDAGVSEEGAFTVTIDGFDAATDKLTLVIVNGTTNLTTQEFDQLTNVEVTSDGISGTQILFAPDSNSQSGKLVLPSIEESFDSDWTATTYTVEIITANLVG